MGLDSPWLFVKHAKMAQKVYKKIRITLKGKQKTKKRWGGESEELEAQILKG